MDLKKAHQQYKSQQNQAHERGIDWDFTFKQWADMWLESGVYHLKGVESGKYVMCRRKDQGPYAPWNVEIRTSDSNRREYIDSVHRQMRPHLIPEGDSWLNRLRSWVSIVDIDRERIQSRSE